MKTNTCFCFTDSAKAFLLSSAQSLSHCQSLWARCPWGFSRQGYWTGLPCPPQSLSNPATEPGLLHCRWIHYHLSHLGSLWLWLTTNCGKFLKRCKYQTTLSVSWETCMEAKKQPDMKWWTGSKLGKGYIKAVYCPLSYLTYMQSASCEMLAEWITS